MLKKVKICANCGKKMTIEIVCPMCGSVVMIDEDVVDQG
jgi:DNA-directed RNA polymerase subunit RPC12/RpoP